jgi:hypothetical protein
MDVNAVKNLVGAHQGDARYNFRADMDDNGVIDLIDGQVRQRRAGTNSPQWHLFVPVIA